MKRCNKSLKELNDNLKHNKYHCQYRLHLYGNNRSEFEFAKQYRGMVNKLYSMNKQVRGQAVLSSNRQAYWCNEFLFETKQKGYGEVNLHVRGPS